MRRVLVSDSAFDTSGQQKSQHGWLIGYSTSSLAKGDTAPFSLIYWKSRRLRRKASSSLLCEALSLSKAMANFLWTANLEMMFRITGHKHGMPLSLCEVEIPTVLSKQKKKAVDPPAQLVIDAKALYDLLLTEQQGQDDERAALEVSLIKEDMESLACLPR